MNRTFCVYRHIRLDKNTPFYVGKGTLKRARNLYARNFIHKRIRKKYGCQVEIIENYLTEEEAFNKEIEFIKLYKSLGYCEANMTLGGEGLSGFTKSKDSRLKTARSHGARKVSVYKKDGTFIGEWLNLQDCAKELNVHREFIYQILNKKANRHSTKGYYFKYSDDPTSVEELTKDIIRKWTENQRIKMKEIASNPNNPWSGKTLSQEIKDKISKTIKESGSNRGVNNFWYGKTGELSPNYGKKHTEETRAKMRKSFKDKPRSFEHIHGKNSYKWAGYVVTPMGIYESLTEAGKIYGICRKIIANRCRSQAPEWSEWFLTKELLNYAK
jgi:group I intron endonuclease